MRGDVANLPVLLRKPGQLSNPRFGPWPLELGLGTHNPRFVAWPLELGGKIVGVEPRPTLSVFCDALRG